MIRRVIVFVFLTCNLYAQSTSQSINYYQLANAIDVFQKSNFRFPKHIKELMQFMDSNNIRETYLNEINSDIICDLTLNSIEDTLFVKSGESVVVKQGRWEPCYEMVGDEITYLNTVYFYGKEGYALLNVDSVKKAVQRTLYNYYAHNGGLQIDIDSVNFRLLQFMNGEIIDYCDGTILNNNEIRISLQNLVNRKDRICMIRFILVTH